LDARSILARDSAECVALANAVHGDVLLWPLGEKRRHPASELLRARAIEAHVEMVAMPPRVLHDGRFLRVKDRIEPGLILAGGEGVIVDCFLNPTIDEDE